MTDLRMYDKYINNDEVAALLKTIFQYYLTLSYNKTIKYIFDENLSSLNGTYKN